MLAASAPTSAYSPHHGPRLLRALPRPRRHPWLSPPLQRPSPLTLPRPRRPRLAAPGHPLQPRPQLASLAPRWLLPQPHPTQLSPSLSRTLTRRSATPAQPLPLRPLPLLPLPLTTTPSGSSVAARPARLRRLTTVLPLCSLAPPGPPPATQHRWGIAALGPRASGTGNERRPLSPRPPAPAPVKHALPPRAGTPHRESASFPAGMRPALPHLGSPLQVHALLLAGRLRAGRATTPPPTRTHPHSPSTLQTP